MYNTIIKSHRANMKNTIDLSEDKLIDYLEKQFPSKDNLVGIGDDCAVIPPENGSAYLVTTDALVEGVHFLKEQVSPQDLGFKTVAVNVSDIAAMGGEPKYAFLSIALPKAIDYSWVRNFMKGVKEACDQWGILLLGGDTVGSKRDVFLNLTLIGTAAQNHIKYRHQAQSGDIICVSGYLGDSGGGLKALQTQAIQTEDIQKLIQTHFRPAPSPVQGKWLASHQEVHAMMDISDGLECDLRKLIKKSGKGAVLEISQIPISEKLSRACMKEGWDALQLAIVGGEDYRLLFTVAAEACGQLQKDFQNEFKSPLFTIGHIQNEPNTLHYLKNGEPIQINYVCYDHFRKID